MTARWRILQAERLEEAVAVIGSVNGVVGVVVAGKHDDSERKNGRRVLHHDPTRESLWRSPYTLSPLLFAERVDSALRDGMAPEQYELLTERHIERRTLTQMAHDRGVTFQAVAEQVTTAEGAAMRAIPGEVSKLYSGKRGRPAYDSEGIRFAATATLTQWRADATKEARLLHPSNKPLNVLPIGESPNTN